MTEDDDPYPLWEEPATKGDVIQAMIWGQSLHTAMFKLSSAFRSGDDDRIKEALSRYDEEYTDYQRKIAEIAGRPEDD